MYRRHSRTPLKSRPQCWLVLSAICLLGMLSFRSNPVTHANLVRRNEPLRIDAQACVYDASLRRLVIKGEAFHPNLSVALETPAGPLHFTAIQFAGLTTLYVEGVSEQALQHGVTISLSHPVLASTVTVNLSAVPTVFSIPVRRSEMGRQPVAREAAQVNQLSLTEVQQILAQAVVQAEADGLRAAVAVVDAEGNNLGVFLMTGSPETARVGLLRAGCTRADGLVTFPLPCGLEGVRVPICTAAISKAVTASFLSSSGHAFTPRTASFIVQEHFPPGINFQPSGPLFGVQFSQLLCSDVNPKAPLGLSAGAGAIPLYKNGIKVGAIGIEGDGRYAFDPLPSDLDVALEEVAALAGARGFEPPVTITGDKIIINGIRLPYVDVGAPPPLPVRSFNQLPGKLTGCCLRDDVMPASCLAPLAADGSPTVRNSLPSEFIPATLGDAPPGRVKTKLFPMGTASYRSTPDFSRDEVIRVLTQAAKQAFLTRAAIRQPLNSAAEVNIAVCDPAGNLLGLFSTADAPQFGLDVAVQKARTAAFFSNAAAATLLRQAGLGKFVDAAARDGLRLDGSVAFSDRAVGFLSRPLYPDGIDRTLPGPFSVPLADFSPFNVGFQLDAIGETYFENILKFIRDKDVPALLDAVTTPCGNPLLGAAINNGFQIFPGSVPLFKNGKLVGAIGVSGDGVDQDDLIAAMGSTGFEAPSEIRADRISVRGTRLPYVKFPRQPNRD
jgi:uncharacterized protein GlcG (DUF336 family)